MADTPQALREFTQNLLSDLSSGAITVHEAYAAANQYAYLRQELSDASLILSEAAALGEEELTQAFAGIITETIEKISELPSFQTQQPDAVETEKNIRDVAALQKTATARIRESEKGRPDKNKRRAFVHSLVDRFSSTAPTLTENQIDRLVERSSVAAARVAPAEQQSRFAQQLTDSIENSVIGMPDNQKRELATAVNTVVTEQKDFVAAQISGTRQELAVYAALFGAAELKRPDVFTDVVLNAPQSESLNESLTRAEKLARVAQSLEEANNSRGGRLQFFSANGAKGIAGGIQKGADGILSLIGEPAREMLLHEKVNGTLRGMLTSTQRFADRLGESFVRSAVFTHITQDLTRQLAQKPQGGQARTIFDDVFSSVFRGPLAAPLTHSTQNGILDFYELARANAAAPAGKKFLTPGTLPWDVFRSFERAGGRPGFPRYGGGSSRKSLLSLLGLGSLGGFFGNVVSGIIDKTTSMALLNPRLPGQLSASRRAAGIPIPLADDMPLLTALVVVIVLLLFFLFPSPFNLNTISHSSKISALFTSLTTNQSAPDTTNNNGWPVKCGCIINGPFEDTHSGNQLNAIDFKFTGCSPTTNVGLYATAKGKVTAVSQQYGVGETCFSREECGGRSTYGNYIQITITEGPANGYVVLYAHMATIKVSEGQSVDKGDLVGTSNHNGLSYAEHLHFEVMGSHSHPPLNQTNPITPQAATNGLCVTGGI